MHVRTSRGSSTHTYVGFHDFLMSLSRIYSSGIAKFTIQSFDILIRDDLTCACLIATSIGSTGNFILPLAVSYRHFSASHLLNQVVDVYDLRSFVQQLWPKRKVMGESV